jgi:hypothetical protein
MMLLPKFSVDFRLYRRKLIAGQKSTRHAKNSMAYHLDKTNQINTKSLGRPTNMVKNGIRNRIRRLLFDGWLDNMVIVTKRYILKEQFACPQKSDQSKRKFPRQISWIRALVLLRCKVDARN